MFKNKRIQGDYKLMEQAIITQTTEYMNNEVRNALGNFLNSYVSLDNS